MRWARGLLPLVALSFVLVACTGTTENLPPLLLAVSRVYGAGSAPQMVLVEDSYNSSNASATSSSSPTVLNGSAEPLPYPAVASDTVDRAGNRPAVIVLTRDLAGGTSPASALVTFNLTGIDPASPTAFRQTSLLQLTGGTTPLFSGTGGPWCFSGISVSLTGRFVYLVDDPNACLSSPTPGAVVRLYQVDTATRQATEVAPPSSPLLPTVPFDDQQSSPNESLYVAVQGVQGSFAQLWKVPVPYDSTQWTQPATMTGTDQLALKGSGTTLLTATNASPYGTPTQGVPSAIDSLSLPASGGGTSVATIDGVRAMAVDPTGASTQVVVAGYDRSAVLAKPSDAQPEAETPSYYGLTGVAATMDYRNNYAYVINNGTIVRLDLLSLGTSSSGWYAKFSLSTDLALPTDAGGRYLAALSWARAIAAAP